MKADQRRRIADFSAQLAIDVLDGQFHALLSSMAYPEELLDLQHEIEDQLYRELADTKRFGP